MTNYNERLDEVLGKLIIGTQDLDFNKAHPNTHQHYVNRAKAKQALTSLIKELVAEAKPAKAVISDYEMGIDRARKSSANHAINQFEQNLLKALEEV